MASDGLTKFKVLCIIAKSDRLTALPTPSGVAGRDTLAGEGARGARDGWIGVGLGALMGSTTVSRFPLHSRGEQVNR